MELIKDQNFYEDCLKHIHINESWNFNFDVKNKLKRYNTFEEYLNDIHIHTRNNVNYKKLYEQLLHRYYIDYLNGPFNLYESFTQYDLYNSNHDVNYSDYIYDDLTGIVYHITKTKYVDKIIKYGLVPKSANKGCIHPDRIYVLSEQPMTKYKFFANDLYNSDKDDSTYCLLKIKLKQHILYLHNKTKLKFLNDPNVTVGPNNMPVAFYTCYARII